MPFVWLLPGDRVDFGAGRQPIDPSDQLPRQVPADVDVDEFEIGRLVLATKKQGGLVPHAFSDGRRLATGVQVRREEVAGKGFVAVVDQVLVMDGGEGHRDLEDLAGAGLKHQAGRAGVITLRAKLTTEPVVAVWRRVR